MRGGSGEFSLRRVAEAAGMTAGNLTYHFPTKRALVRSLIALLLDEYEYGIRQLFAGLPSQPELALDRLVTWLMQDASTPAASRVFRELWAMALHDATVARMVDDFYERAIANVVTLLRTSDPTIAESDAQEAAYLVALLSEGTNVLYGTSKRRTVPLDRLSRTAGTLVAAALRSRHPVPDLTHSTEIDHEIR